MDKNTPRKATLKLYLPWSTDGEGLIKCQAKLDMLRNVADIGDEELAAEITRRVNCHDQLVEVVTEALAIMDEMNWENDQPGLFQRLSLALVNARASSEESK